MALTATPARRRIAMAVLLLLAVAGAVIRKLAPDPSTLRDIGTLLLVLWLPAVGNLIAWLIRTVGQRRAAARGFDAQAAFVPHVHARLEPLDMPQPLRDALPRAGASCMLLVGQQAFTARLSQSVERALAGPQAQDIQLLRPDTALAHLAPGTAFHLLVGTTAVARGVVTAGPMAA